MAARKSHHYLNAGETPNAAAPHTDQFELDEADVIWSTNDVMESKKQVRYNKRPARKPLRKSGGDVDRFPVGPKSVPVNIPDWTKILGGEYRGRAAEYDYDVQNDKIPPHEYLARIRGASLSVHEGVGRTLKGRDLSRVRNAIWKQIGFED